MTIGAIPCNLTRAIRTLNQSNEDTGNQMASNTSTRRKLTLGKIAALRRLADEQGIFCITAMDQRNSLTTLRREVRRSLAYFGAL